MTTTPNDEPRRRHLEGWLPFIRHYIEMVLAMAVGMLALMPLGTLAFQPAGAPHLLDHAEPMALVMATGMALGMGAWMAGRRHGWRDIAEMSAAMYLPFVIFFPDHLGRGHDQRRDDGRRARAHAGGHARGDVVAA